MRNFDFLIHTIAQSLSNAPHEIAYFTTVDWQYAYSQLNLHADTARLCIFNFVTGFMNVTYGF